MVLLLAEFFGTFYHRERLFLPPLKPRSKK
jgi:hypothetical protein